MNKDHCARHGAVMCGRCAAKIPDKDSGWKMKALHRKILLSSTYRQSGKSPQSEIAKRIDAENHLLWRMNRKRLEGESIRDNMLLASGQLNRELGGAPVRMIA